MEYLVQQEEICPTTQREHWQGLVVFEGRQRVSALKKLLSTAHWEPMRGSLQEAASYCYDASKRAPGGLLLEDGIKPVCGDEARGNATRERYKLAYDLAKEGAFEKIEPSMMVRHMPNLLRIHNFFGVRPSDLNQQTCPGVWIHGLAGSGKTTLCAAWPHYKKDPRHKWFDSYQREQMVVVDDMSPYHIAQTDILKQLGHQFAFQAEIKGATIWLRPKAVIVTSQYTLDQIWEKDPESCAAIRRRYAVFCLPLQREQAIAYVCRLLSSLPDGESGCSDANVVCSERNALYGRPEGLGRGESSAVGEHVDRT